MNKHEGHIKGFRQLSKSWYRDANLRMEGCVDIIELGFYTIDEGGTSGEFSIRWEHLNGEVVPIMRLFSDGWSALANMPELIKSLSELDSINPHPDEFASMLEKIGFLNMTQTTILRNENEFRRFKTMKIKDQVCSLKQEMKENSDELPEKIEDIKAGPVSANELVNTLQGYNGIRDTYLISRQDLLVFVRLCEQNDRKRIQPVIDKVFDQEFTNALFGLTEVLATRIIKLLKFKEKYGD